MAPVHPRAPASGVGECERKGQPRMLARPAGEEPAFARQLLTSHETEKHEGRPIVAAIARVHRYQGVVEGTRHVESAHHLHERGDPVRLRYVRFREPQRCHDTSTWIRAGGTTVAVADGGSHYGRITFHNDQVGLAEAGGWQ